MNASHMSHVCHKALTGMSNRPVGAISKLRVATCQQRPIFKCLTFYYKPESSPQIHSGECLLRESNLLIDVNSFLTADRERERERDTE